MPKNWAEFSLAGRAMNEDRMTREVILSEIRRTAQENGGVAHGKKRFLDATGIAESDWSGRYWTR